MTGCTCGKCVGGILSPRTAFRFKKCAEVSAELLDDTMPAFPGALPMHDPEAYLFDYVPPEQRVEVTKPFIVGFGNCIRTIAYLLQQDQLPKPKVVAQCARIVPGVDKSASRVYLESGGEPEYALDAVLARCVEEHEELGDGSFAQEEDNARRLEALPPCANDDQYELLRQKLFENSSFWPCGPYAADDEYEGAEDEYVYYDNSNWVPR